jgi:hypothetical protein
MTTENQVPRRACIDKRVPAELSIDAAIEAVEKMAADVRLTDAIVLLQAAKDSVSDYIDGLEQFRRRPLFSQFDGSNNAVGAEQPA